MVPPLEIVAGPIFLSSSFFLPFHLSHLRPIKKKKKINDWGNELVVVGLWILWVCALLGSKKNHDTRPKEMTHWANPMGSKIKKGLSSQKKMVVDPKDLKPKIHEGAGFKSPWNRGKKEKGPACQDQRTKECPVERTRLEIPGTCGAAKVGLR